MKAIVEFFLRLGNSKEYYFIKRFFGKIQNFLFFIIYDET